MRLVVGPLPAGVYWKRRAIVLGALVLAIVIVTYSCTTAGKTVDPKAVKSSTPSPITTVTASPTAQGVVPVNEVTSSPTPAPPAEGICTDAEIKVTPVPAKSTMAVGTEITIKLLIKNISNRSCNRDVGADMQELRIVLGTEKLWSSDDCGGLTGSDVRPFPPNLERSYEVIWNGRSSSSCSATQKHTPTGSVSPGEYQLFGRVGTDLSEPVTLKLS
jgi:hypothetical protein